MCMKFQGLLLASLLILIFLPIDGAKAYEPLVTICKPDLDDILYSPDGRFLATLTQYYLELLDGENLAPVTRVPVYEGGRTLAFSPDSLLLAISGADEGIQIWQVDSERFLTTIPADTRFIAFSPDGKYFAYANEDSVFLWDVEQMKTVLELPGTGRRVEVIAFHPGSKMLAAGYRNDGNIALWDIETKEILSHLKLQLNRTGYLRAMRFSRDGGSLVFLVSYTSTVNNQPGSAVILLDVSTGDSRNWDGEFSDVVFAPNDQRLIAGGRNGNLHIIDLDTSSVESIPAVDNMPPPNHSGAVRLTHLTNYPDGTRIANLINYSRIRVWDTQDFSRLQTLYGYGYGWGYSMADALYLPKVNRIVTGKNIDVLHFWDATTGELLKTAEFYTRIYDLAASPDGTKVAIAVEYTVQVWDAVNAKQLATFEIDCGPVDGEVEFSPSGKYLVYIGMCGSYFWDMETGEKITWEVEDPWEKQHMDKSWTNFYLVVFSSNGEQIVAIPENFGGQEKTMVWDFETGLPINETDHIGPVVDVGIDFLQAHQVGGTMEIRFLKSNGLLSRIPDDLPEWNHYQILWQAQFHPSGNVLAIHVTGEERFYDVWSGELILADPDILALQFADDGDYVFLVDKGGQLGLYRTSDVIGQSVSPVFAVNPSGKKITTLGQIKHDQLLQNYPNPFNPETWIPYQLGNEAEVAISIYNSSGKLIRALSSGRRSAGNYLLKSEAVYWDGKDNSGEDTASGVYFYTIQAGEHYTATRKMVLTR